MKSVSYSCITCLVNNKTITYLMSHARRHGILVDELYAQLIEKGARELKQGTSELRVQMPGDSNA